jgi:hypothetical protein
VLDDWRRILVAVVAGGQIALGTISGSDVSRYMMPPAILLTCLALASVATRREWWPAVAALVAGSIAIFRPWDVVGPGSTEFVAWWAPRVSGNWSNVRSRIVVDGIVAIVAVALAAAFAFLAGRSRRRSSIA